MRPVSSFKNIVKNYLLTKCLRFDTIRYDEITRLLMCAQKLTASQLNLPDGTENRNKLECGPMPNVMAALPNIGGTLCSTLQSLADVHCRAATLPRRETRGNWQGCHKLANRSQPVMDRSSPYYGNLWRRYCCLLSIRALVAKIQTDKVVQHCPDGEFLAIFCI